MAAPLTRPLPSPLLRPSTGWIVPTLLAAVAVFLLVGSFQSAQFAQLTISGLATGGIYASLALALVLIYRATEVINFAQGGLATFSTYVGWQLIVGWGLTYWLGFALTLLISFAGGMLVELVAIRPVERRGNVLTVVIASIGLLILAEGAVGWIWGPTIRFMPSPFPAHFHHVGGVSFSVEDLGTIGMSILSVLVLWAFFQFTKVGLGMRAAAVRPAAARWSTSSSSAPPRPRRCGWSGSRSTLSRGAGWPTRSAGRADRYASRWTGRFGYERRVGRTPAPGGTTPGRPPPRPSPRRYAISSAIRRRPSSSHRK